jgi:2-dehydro-3-deoxyphosphogluconate aldolase/(4S)-4-hydroxy-2-oxoglutarate aldolase
VPALPGCFSPTEILEAWDAGAAIVKVFPASAVGFGFFRDLRGPLPHIKLMPTGGVTIEDAADWIRAGAVAVGVGSVLTDPAALATRDYAGIAAKARRLVDAVRDAQGTR